MPAALPCAPSDPPDDPCSPIREWVSDDPDTGLFDHERSDGEGDDQADDNDGDERDAGDDQAGEEGDPDDADHDDLRIVALPVLTEDVLLDHDALDLVLAEVVEASSVARQVQAEIDRLHEALQGVLEPVHFATILQAEQLGQARLGVLLSLVASWAWAEGRACREEDQ